jgi:tetratricopeptide (TPR) repeat protein
VTTSPSSASGPYRHRDIRSLYPAVTENHLRYLAKWGLLRASGPRDAREYSFADLLTIRHVAAELEQGTPLRSILRGLASEREGQLELDFHAHTGPDTPRAKVVAIDIRKPRRNVQATGGAAPLAVGQEGLSTYPFSDPQSALAAKYFVEGSRLDDGDERKMEAAAAAYRKALIIDPDLVPAIVNLANLHYARDEIIEAQALYERAISLDPDCFEAHFNLGNILHDLGRYESALVCYRDAVELNPRFADAHFYLAVTLEKTGRSPDAKPHWRQYLELAPTGEWAELAQEFLD